MNITRYDLVKSLHQNNSQIFFAALITDLFIFPFYAGWFVYFLSEVFYLRKKLRALIHRCPSSETAELLYKCRGDYYKYILMLFIALTELMYFLAIILSLYNTESNVPLDEFELIIRIKNDFSTSSYVLALGSLFLINILTQHLINVCKSDCRIQLLPPIQHRLVTLTLIAMILIAIKLAIQEFDNVIVEVVCVIFSSYEYWSLFNNSQQLYYLLKWRYQDMRYESNYPLYKAHRRMAQKYKYLTAFVLFGILFMVIVSWLHIPITFFNTILEFNYPPQVLMSAVAPLLILKYTIAVCLLVGSTPVFLLVGVSLYYLAAVCCNKTVLYGRNRIYYIEEPQIQQ